MIGRMVRKIAGRSLERTLGVSGAGGLLPETLIATLPVVARRLSPAGLLAVAAGGIVLRRLIVRNEIRKGLAAERAAADGAETAAEGGAAGSR